MEAEDTSKPSVAAKIAKELTRRQALKAGAGLTGLAVALAALPAKAHDAAGNVYLPVIGGQADQIGAG